MTPIPGQTGTTSTGPGDYSPGYLAPCFEGFGHMTEVQGASADADQALVSDGAPTDRHPSGFDPSRGWLSDWEQISAAADRDTGDEGEDGFNIGRRDGFSEAVQLIDVLTGGDGEYYASTLPGRGCADPDAMISRIIARFDARDSDRNPEGEDAQRLSAEHESAGRDSGIAQPIGDAS